MTFLRSSALLLVAAACFCTAVAQNAASVAAKTYTAPRHEELTKQYEEFLAIPNVALDPAGLKKNAEFLMAQLQSVGAEAKLLTAPGLPAGTPPVVWGEVKTPGATRTIVFYAHYDGQPVTPSEWDTGKPFTPAMKMVDGEERVYAVDRAAGAAGGEVAVEGESAVCVGG
jgi:hypothetical protein